MAKLKNKTKAFNKAILSVFGSVFGKYTKFIARIFKTGTGVTCLCIFLSLFMCILGVVIVITKDQLTFVNDITIGTSQELSEEAKKAGKNLTEYEKWALMANALNRDLMASDFKSGGKYADLYKSNKKTDTASRSLETPAKDVDIFLLIDEIWTRPELNGDSFSCKVPVEVFYGKWKTESSRSQGNGDRLINSELEYYSGDNNSYYAPTGAKPTDWSQVNSYDSGGGHGCTFISKQENESLEDSKRGIFGGSAMINAGKAYYITVENFSYTKDNSANLLKQSDTAYTYLKSFSITHDPSHQRGCITWLPDALYSLLYEIRPQMEGYHKDTHTTSGPRGLAQKVAVDDLKTSCSLTNEEAGLVQLYFANGNRLSKENAGLTWGNKEAPNSELVGMLDSWFIIAVHEGFFSDFVEKAATDETINKDCQNNRKIIPHILGDDASGGSWSGLKMNDHAVYTQVYNAIKDNTLKGTYPQEIIDRAIKFKDAMANPESSLKLYTGLCGGRHQCCARLVRGIDSYVRGHCVLHQYGSLIESYYNYQEDGKYKYRLYDVDFGEDETTVGDANGTGPFGLPYYNADGSVNELAIVAANDLFADLCRYSNKSKKYLTVPNSITVTTITGETATFALKGGEYPNFWGSAFNCNASSWGQCPWWSKGRSMLWLYENVSTDQKIWGVHSSTGASWAGNHYINGDGVKVVPNLKRASGGTTTTEIKANSIASAGKSGNAWGHTWWIEAVDNKNGIYYMSHGNISSSKFAYHCIPEQYGGKSKYGGNNYDSFSGDRGPKSSGNGYNMIMVAKNGNHWGQGSYSGQVYFCYPDNLELIKRAL